jgi:ankyrin repeat protein
VFHFSLLYSFLANYDGRTALHHAVSGNHLDCVKFLFSSGVPHVTDKSGHTPLQQAIKNHQYSIASEIEILLVEQVIISL